MFPANPFLQLTLPRVTKALVRVQALIWSPLVSPTSAIQLSYAGSRPDAIPFVEAKKLSYKPIQLPHHWGRLFDQGWYKVQLPKTNIKEQVYLHWQDQGEGTAYIDGVPFYGFDVAHRYCPLPRNVTELYVESLCLESAIWHPAATGIDPEGSKLSIAALVTRNPIAWDVWHDLRMLYELAFEEAKANSPLGVPKQSGVGFQQPIDVVSPLYRRLLRSLDDAVNAFDTGGLPGIQKVLKDTYKKFAGQHDRIKSVLTGHAHIDLVWLWPESSSEYKATHTFATMNRLMDLYPEFVFGYSQPASYDAVDRISPGLMKQVKKRINSGQWEALGATEVESDTLMACGEALSRSFLLGQKGFNRLQGKPSRVLWIPDVFGYAGCLPQIMKQTGVEYFFTTKLTWSNINLFPYSSFKWQGTDGSEVLVHVTQDNGYNQLVSPEEIRRGSRAYRQSDVHDEFLSPTGYGDGGGGVTEEMCERARRVQSLAGMPQVGWGRVDTFFDKLNEVREKLPSWQGELYLEYHRGVLTTHSLLKARFRETERALQTWEAARCAIGKGELDDHPWRRLVFAQFHDYIPGSSVWEVYENGLPELAAISKNALESAASELGKGSTPALFNPLPVERIVVLDDASKAVILPPLSGAPIIELPSLAPTAPAAATTKKLSSDHVAVSFDAKGRIASLSFGENQVAIRSALGELVTYPDFPHEFEAWDIDRQTVSLGTPASANATAKVIRAGGLDAVVEFTKKIGKASTVTIRYRIDAFQPVLHIEYDLDWHEEQTLLKAVFPTAYAGRMARFGSPFGSVLRGQQAGQSRDEAMFESAASRWAIVSDDGDTAGLGVISEAKFGFSCRDGTLGVSLLRSPKVTGQEVAFQKLFPGDLRRGEKRVDCADQGRHTLKLALAFHSTATPREHLVPALADSLFTPTLSYLGTAVRTGFLGIEGCETVVPSWAKPAADGKGWILRLHETMGRRGVAKIRLAEGFEAYATNLSEETLDKKPIQSLSVTPYSLMSVRIVKR